MGEKIKRLWKKALQYLTGQTNSLWPSFTPVHIYHELGSFKDMYSAWQ